MPTNTHAMPRGKEPKNLAKVEQELRNCVTLDALWGSLLRVETRHLPSFCTGFFLYPVDVGRPTAFKLKHPFVNWKHPADWRKPFMLDEAVAYLKANPGCGPFRIREIFSDLRKWEASRFYREICEPTGWYYRIVVPLWEEGRFIGAASFHRSKTQGAYSDEERAMLTELQPCIRLATLRVLRVEEAKLEMKALDLAVTAISEQRTAAQIDCVGPAATGASRPQAHGNAAHLPTADMRRLTQRERQVVKLASTGLSNREIAGRLGTSRHTVRAQVSSSLRKLGLASRYELAGVLP